MEFFDFSKHQITNAMLTKTPNDRLLRRLSWNPGLGGPRALLHPGAGLPLPSGSPTVVPHSSLIQEARSMSHPLAKPQFSPKWNRSITVVEMAYWRSLNISAQLGACVQILSILSAVWEWQPQFSCEQPCALTADHGGAIEFIYTNLSGFSETYVYAFI